MKDTIPKKKPYFLSGEGEMATLIRDYDWAKTPVGSPEQWPENLRLTLSMITSSKFPMFLWWGQDLIQFYNDAYRPSLGNNGKHPLALGQKGKDCWPEIWDTIGPLIHQVQTTSKATWSEDQLIPIYRNGKIEDVYWTFGYSPIFGSDGEVDGVLVVCNETTEKILSQKALKESEQRFRTMAEGADVFITVTDQIGSPTYYNKNWIQLTGRSLEELLERGMLDLIHPEEKNLYTELFPTHSEEPKTFSGEFRVLNKDGEYCWLLAKRQVRTMHDGSFGGYISSCVDITQRKIAEDISKEKEAMIRALIDSAPFPIGVYTGKEMRIDLANQAILDAWGKGNEVIGQKYSEILPELENQEIFDQLDRVYTTGIPFHRRNQLVELLIDNKLSSFYFNYSFTPLYDSRGEIYGVMNTAAEVTDLNTAKQQVEQSERNFRNIIVQAPVAMCIMLGENHTVSIANDYMIKLWGKPVNDVMNKPIFEGLPEVKNQGLEQLLAHVYSTGETFTANERMVELMRNGKLEKVYQNFVYEPYRDSDGNILGVLATTLDVSEQVRARREIEGIVAERTKELETANNSLEKSNGELAQFAYVASHDLQEPLRKISTFTQMLDQRASNQLDDQAKNYLSKINSSAMRMNTLIRDILAYSELSREHVAFETLDLNQVLENTLTDYELLIEQKRASISYRPLPIIDAIPLQMSQLFYNIIGNSLKFARENSNLSIEISVEELVDHEREALFLDPNFEYKKIVFRDNGIGFKPEYGQQIFNIFQRLHRKSEYAGTGIGLALCKKIALNHQGELTADGSSEEGAVFNVILPVNRNHAA